MLYNALKGRFTDRRLAWVFVVSTTQQAPPVTAMGELAPNVVLHDRDAVAQSVAPCLHACVLPARPPPAAAGGPKQRQTSTGFKRPPVPIPGSPYVCRPLVRRAPPVSSMAT